MNNQQLYLTIAVAPILSLVIVLAGYIVPNVNLNARVADINSGSCSPPIPPPSKRNSEPCALRWPTKASSSTSSQTWTSASTASSRSPAAERSHR